MSCLERIRSGGCAASYAALVTLHQVAVEPLDAAATAALVDRTLGPAAPTLRRAVFDRTDGIPLYVTELAAALAASGRLKSGTFGPGVA